eukprot:CFRG8525T1
MLLLLAYHVYTIKSRMTTATEVVDTVENSFYRGGKRRRPTIANNYTAVPYSSHEYGVYGCHNEDFEPPVLALTLECIRMAAVKGTAD